MLYKNLSTTKGVILMNLSIRQRMILDILLQEEQGITVGEIAERIEVSSRTIHREMTDLEKLLRKFELTLEKKSGFGVQILGEPQNKEKLNDSLFNLTTTEYTAQERKVIILCTLLEATEPIKLLSLSIDLKVTTATISHDLDDVEEWVKRYELRLIRKRGYGVEVQGTESAKRKCMSSLIADHLNEHVLLDMIKDNIHNKSINHIDSIAERLLGLVDKSKLIKIENALSDLDQELPYPLADSAYIALVIHLALAIERIEKGEKIHFDEETLENLRNKKEYQIAEHIIQRLNKTLGIDIPLAEIGYITMHLRGAKLRSTQQDPFWSDNVELLTKTQQFIRQCEKKLGVPLSKDSSLLEGLVTHMEPALYRISRNMKIRNPLLLQIQQDYPELYQIIQEIVKEVFPNIIIPDEEIGYLVMHIGAAQERSQTVTRHYRALVVCSSGIGSSKILATRIKKEIPEIEIMGILSLFEVSSISKNNYDLIISTISLPLPRDEYLIVSPLLPKSDVAKIRAFFPRVQMNDLHEQLSPTKLKSTKNAVEQMKELYLHLEASLKILEHFRVIKLTNRHGRIENILTEGLGLLPQNYTQQEIQNIIFKLMEREKLGGLGIPDTDLALFHTRCKEVKSPVFSILALSQPLYLKSMDHQEIEINKILLLLAPSKISKEGMSVLSEISSLLILKETLEVIQSNESDQIIHYFADKLYQFCQTNRK